MRTLHRLLAIVALGVLLFIGGSGTLIQSIDLYTLLRHAPEDDPVMMSINEGRYGPPDFEVLSAYDFTAIPLPASLDIPQSMANALQAWHQQATEASPRFVELRMARGVAIGQVGIGKNVQAFDASSGSPVASTNLSPITRTLMPPSLRQTTKQLHRFWISHDVPGVWVELISGLVLWTLLISGLIMYFKLLKARAKLKRRQLFWFAGGWWRSLHRIISVVASVFLVLVAFSGTWLGFESVYHTFAAKPGPHVDPMAPISDIDVQQMTAATLTSLKQAEPQTPIKVLRVRLYGGMKQGIVVTGGPETRQLVFNTETMQPVSLTEPGYPDSGFPFGTEVHENFKHFHAGMPFGLLARFLDLFAGLSLVFLCISGLTMYLDMWLRRRKSGRGNFLWT